MDPLLENYTNPDDENQDDHYIKDLEQDVYNFNCAICYEDYNLKVDEIQVKMLKCGHTFCKDCFTATFQNYVDNNQGNKMKCPQFECEMKPTNDEIKEILSQDQYQKFEKFKQNQAVMRNKNLVFCPTVDCENPIDLKKNKGKTFNCTKCEKTYCKKCKKLEHGKLQCEKESVDEWIGHGLSNVHRCPKCCSVFEKIDGCSEMDCSVCHYKWCWVCGLDYKTKMHALMVFPCQLINMTVLNQSVHGFCRFIVLILYVTFVPLLFLLLFGFCLPMMSYCDMCSRPSYSGRLRCLSQYMFCYRERKHIYLGFFAAVFAWIFWVIICALIAILVTIIFIIPMYVFSVVSLCRMAYWWRKNKRLNKKDLTKEQKQLQKIKAEDDDIESRSK